VKENKELGGLESSSELNPTLGVLLVTKMVEMAVEKEEIEPREAWDFAQSMIEYCVVPVIIDPGDRVLPLKALINLRNLVIERCKEMDIFDEFGTSFDETCEWARELAEKTSDYMSELGLKTILKYYPFRLPPELEIQETLKEAEKDIASQQVLLGDILDFDILEELGEGIEKMLANCPFFINWLCGQHLQKWLKENYGFEPA
jgi:hypothetical protein